MLGVQRVLISWVGDNDMRAALGESAANGPGPIATLFRERSFDRLVLLSSRANPAWVDPFFEWLRAHTTAPIDARHHHLRDPTDHAAIYEFVEPILGELSATGDKLTVHLSPGTPAMHAVWLLLCKTRFAAELVQTSREQGVKQANVPFDIYAELSERLGREALARPPETAAFADIRHRSRPMAEVIEMAARVAAWPVDVLIEGESGTGKELFARAIHAASPRANGPFITVNCGAIPENLVESELFGHVKGAFTGATATRKGRFIEASGGTLFLDELGELPPEAQVKLLRAVEYRELTPVGGSTAQKADVRIVAATHRKLFDEIAAGRFREDLYYRLSNAILPLPSLRERPEDVSLLLDHGLQAANELGATIPGYEEKKLSPSARKLLQQHPWPGNVRELLGTVRRAAIWSRSQVIGIDDARNALSNRSDQAEAAVLHRPLTAGFRLREVLGDVARHYIIRALAESGGVKKEAAELLGFSNYQTLSNWMAKYGIDT
jgi:DNA-binding NtrC family response regulator